MGLVTGDGGQHFDGTLRDLFDRARADAAEESEIRIRNILDSIFAFIGLFSTDGILLGANRAALDAVGMREEDIVGKPFVDAYWWSHSALEQEKVRTALRLAAAGETVRKDLTARVGEGHLIDVDVVFNPLRDATGRIVRVIASGVDITDRRKVEEDLRARLRQQEAVAQLGSIALRTRDLTYILNTAVELVSQVLDNEFCKVLELSPDRSSLLLRAGVGWRPGLVGHATVSAGVDSQAGYTLLTGQPVVVEDLRTETRFNGPALLRDHGIVSGMSVLIQGPDGPYGVLGTHTQQLFRFTQDDVHFLVGIANVLADFIRHQTAEERLNQERAFSSVLFDSLPGITCLFDRRGTFSRWSKSLEQVSGYSVAEIRSMNAVDFIAEGEKVFVGAKIREAFEKGQASLQARLRSRDGTVTPYLFSGIRILTGGEPSVLGIALDISDRQRLEEQLRQSQKMEAFGQLAGGVAHDFNNLLTIILGYCAVLNLNLSAEDSAREEVQHIVKAGERAASLTRQLLAFSRQSTLEPQVLDLNTIVNDTVTMLRRLIGEDILLTTDLEPRLSTLRADPGALTQVLMNLAVNARDAMPTGGNLRIATRNVTVDEYSVKSHGEVRPGAYVVLSVIDSGVGMTEDMMARIFEPFFTTKNRGQGSGLGLAVVHGIAQRTGAAIDVISKPGEGTAFNLHFPALETLVIDRGTQQRRPRKTKRATETVLLAEDEDDVRRLMQTTLRQHGYKVLGAASGEHALKIVGRRQRRIDLLVTDVIMPGMDGRDLAKALSSRFPGMKVLYLSGYTHDAVARHGVFFQEVSFMQKPFAPAALLAKVRDVLDGAESFGESSTERRCIGSG
jgi:two-component system, cell cycle sensor histidine kinase and response regulator CckA